jgi:ATP-binding cassette subfamily B protein
VIASAHRLSTVRGAEQIALLEGGRVMELGDHEELLELGDRYAAMVDLQGHEQRIAA